MQKDNNQPTTYCHSCKRNILTSNFLLHEGRCQRMQELRSSRMSQNSSEKSQKSQKSSNGKVQVNPFQSRRQPYSYPNVHIKQDLRDMKRKPVKNQGEEKIPCPFCGYMQTYAELDTHPQTCEHREVSCNFCGVKYPKSLMQQHSYVCQKNPRNIQRNTRPRPRMSRNQSPEYEHFQQEDDGLPMIFQQRNRNMYRPSSLMDVFNQAFFSGGMENRQQQSLQGPSYQVFQFSSSGNNGQPRIIFRTNSTNPATFVQLIEMLAQRANPNQNPGLNQEELSKLPKVHYHKKNEEPDLCTICYCEFEQNEEIIELSCKHIFHQECIFEWLKRVSTCPVCKKKLKQRHGQEEQQFQQYQSGQHQHNQGRHQNRQQNQGGFFNFFPI